MRQRWILVYAILVLCSLPGILYAQSAQSLRAQAKRLDSESVKAYKEGKLGVAVERSWRAVELYRALRDQDEEAASLLFIGMVELGRKRPQEALTMLQTSLKIYERLTPQPDQLSSNHYFLAQTYIALGRREQAIPHLEAAPVWTRRADKGRKKEALTLANIGKLNAKISRLQEAAALLEEALSILRAAGGTSKEEGELTQSLAELYKEQGQYDRALSLIRESIRIDPTARGYQTLGSILVNAGSFDEALTSLKKAEDLFERAGNRTGLWIARTDEASIYHSQGKSAEALAKYEAAVAAFRKLGDEEQLPGALLGSGLVAAESGHYDEARADFHEALQIQRRSGNKSGEASALNSLAGLEASAGAFDKQLELLEEAVKIRREIGDSQGQVAALRNSALAYLEFGKKEEALERLSEALQISQRTGDKLSQAMVLQGMAQLLPLLGRPAEALARSEEALGLARATGDRGTEAAALLVKGIALVFLGKPEALESLSRARDLCHDLNKREDEAKTLFIVGLVQSALERKAEALESLRQALELQRNLKVYSGSTLTAMGFVEENLGRRKEAIQSYLQAVNEEESLISQAQADDLVATQVGGTMATYEHLIGLLKLEQRGAEAFAIAEQARARTFLRQVGGQRLGNSKVRSPDLVKEERSLRQSLLNLDAEIQQESNKPLTQQNQAELERLNAAVDQARRNYETLLIRLKQANPEYTSLIRPSPLSLVEVQKLLPQDATLIEFFVSDESTLAWVIEHDSYHLVQLYSTRKQLDEEVALLRNQISSHGRAVAPAVVLYIFLFSHLEEHIHHQKLIIVPHGALHAVPFSALLGKELHPLGESHSITLLPSASVLPFLIGKRSANQGRLLALGDPDGSLPHAADEAQAVAKLYGTEPLLGKAATESALRARSKGIDILHISAHATYDKARPLFSRIELAPGDGEDGHLEVHEVFNLDLTGTNLVVLSGCGTGLGAPTEGDDVVNFSRAFLYAGSPSVLATLWPVDDAASAALMESFYRHLRQEGSPASALQAAQLEISKQEKWKTPFYWAGYVLIGDGGWD